MIVLEGQSALSQFRLARLESRLQSLLPSVRIRGAWQVYFVQPEPGASPDLQALRRILQASAEPVAAASDILGKQVASGQRSAGIDDAIEEVARRLN